MQRVVNVNSVVTVTEEGRSITLKEAGMTDLRSIVDYTVSDIIHTEDERKRQGIVFILRREISGGGYTYRNLLFSGKRKFLSDEY